MASAHSALMTGLGPWAPGQGHACCKRFSLATPPHTSSARAIGQVSMSGSHLLVLHAEEVEHREALELVVVVVADQ